MNKGEVMDSFTKKDAVYSTWIGVLICMLGMIPTLVIGIQDPYESGFTNTVITMVAIIVVSVLIGSLIHALWSMTTEKKSRIALLVTVLVVSGIGALVVPGLISSINQPQRGMFMAAFAALYILTALTITLQSLFRS